MTRRRRFLLVDDEAGVRRTLRRILASPGVTLDEAGTVDEAFARLEEASYDLVLTDVRMGDRSGGEILARLRETRPDTPVILMTAYAEVEEAVAAMRAGAADYLTKPFRPDEVRLAVERALEAGALKNEVRNLRARLIAEGDFEGMIGRSKAMRAVFERIARVAASDATVLLTGESGTGKELAARAIHARSDRARGPFVAIDCAAIPGTLLEAELFGYEKGAFTGAFKAKPGLFETADGGTLFLDEVGELPHPLQVKLLRALEERKITRLGATRPKSIDVRIVAATNRDLPKAVAEGAFREDLYYRLNVVPIELPPLRDRREDIPLLAERFLARVAERLGRTVRFSPKAMRSLESMDFPGNVRELENLVERTAVLSDGEVIEEISL